MNSGLVRQLFPGPLDVVGDVHGELEALEDLMRVLGYGLDARHPEGRRLVFVGDLCDRGPDSVGVIDRVQGWIAQGRAQCVLGNHELNLLRDDRKEGNGWFFGSADHPDAAGGRFDACTPLPQERRETVLSFLASLPLVLERDDLCVVHACPSAAAVAAARSAADPDPLSFYDQSERDLAGQIGRLPDRRLIDEQAAFYRTMSTDPAAGTPSLPALAAEEALYQNGNAARVLTSGMEVQTDSPFFIGGKWRLLSRVRWWDDYREPLPVIFGHYWRTPAGMPAPRHKGGSGPFGATPDSAWLGPLANVFCVDHCVGGRFIERTSGITEGFATRLSAMRWPERELVMDNGRRVCT